VLAARVTIRDAKTYPVRAAQMGRAA